MFNNLKDLADLMKNAGKIRENVEKATEALGEIVAEGSAGGGLVSARANGRMELVSLRIAPEAAGDAGVLEGLVTAAVNAALAKAREAAAQSMASIAGGLPIPGLSGLMGPSGGGR